MEFTQEQIEKYLKMKPGDLTDLGVCPTCFNRFVNDKFYGDTTNMLLYKDKDIECLLVGNPRANGHMMISTMEHYHDLSEAPDYINEKIIRFTKQFMIAIKQIYGCERVYLCTMSDGPMNHYHVQLIPRYSFEERGSKNFVKPRKQYVFDKEKFEKLKQYITNYANLK